MSPETWFVILDPQGRSVAGTLSSYGKQEAIRKFRIDNWHKSWLEWQQAGFRVAVAEIEWRDLGEEKDGE